VRLLWLTPELPHWPGGSGGATRQFKLIEQLVARGDEVHVVAPVHPGQRDGARGLAAAGATLHAVHRPAGRAGEAAGALLRRPALALDALRLPILAWQVEVFWTSLRPIARRLLAAERFDVVHVEHDWAARWAADLPPGPPLVCGLENLSWRYYERRAEAAGGVAALGHRLEARRFATFDRRRLAAYDLLLTMSRLDDRLLRAVSDVPSAVVPNGVDTSALLARPLPAEPVALFTGTFGYPPNAEALVWLLRELWPQIRARVPAARLLVVGRDVPAPLAAPADDSVTLAGWVPEMQPWFDRARAVLVPMRSGGGTRLKVLDALASGRPLVSTTMGAEGVEVSDGRDALLADDADGFAAAAARVLAGDDALAQRLGAAGRRLAEETYDWRAIGARLGAELDRLVARSDARLSGRA
jgi:glycosyltransferase involved in cell wall biosynthesis